MVEIAGNNKNGIDFSIMPSLLCDLECPHCMYDAGPNKFETIDIAKLERFLYTIPFGKINSIGMYGGEPSMNTALYSKIIKLLPTYISKWVITNGAWTNKSLTVYEEFMRFVQRHDLIVFVSSTPYHKSFQNDLIINTLKQLENFSVKEDDTLHKLLPMGRNSKPNWKCTYKCLRADPPLRYAVMPNGNIIFQSCDGVYPVVGDYTMPFSEIINIEIPCSKIQERSKHGKAWQTKGNKTE